MAPETNTSPSPAVTIARVLAVAAIVVAVVVVSVILLGGGGDHTYKLRFQNAGQIVKGDEVQVGGRRAGSVKEIELTNNNTAQITISVDNDFAPLHDGTTAIIRATSLSGIANRYIALTLGANSAPKLEDGATLGAEKTTAPVDLDQLFNTLDPKTRRSLQNVIQGSAAQYQGKGRQANESAHYFNPALTSTDRLVNELTLDQQSLTNFIVDSSQLVTSIAARRSDLSSLVGNTNRTAAAIGSENTALARTLDLLPTTLRRANTTFVNLRATLGDLDVLVAASKPATRRLAPFFRQLRPLVAAARPTIRDLSHLVHLRGPNNDITDATLKLPRLQQIATPTFANTITSLKKSQKVIEFIRPYAPDLVGWFRDFGEGAANYDANGHFARIQPIFNAYSLNGNTLTPNLTSQKLDGLQTGVVRRCPGAASQPAQDGSAPYRDSGGTLDCDPKLVLPGP